MTQTLSRIEAKTISQARDEIKALDQKEKTIRDAIAALPKKGAINEQQQLERETKRVVKQRQFWESLSKLDLGTRVVASHRKNEEGIVLGFQEYAGRVVGVWVRWGQSNVAMPEYPVLLKVTYPALLQADSVGFPFHPIEPLLCRHNFGLTHRPEVLLDAHN